jgi:hypothetical protein
VSVLVRGAHQQSACHIPSESALLAECLQANWQLVPSLRPRCWRCCGGSTHCALQDTRSKRRCTRRCKRRCTRRWAAAGWNCPIRASVSRCTRSCPMAVCWLHCPPALLAACHAACALVAPELRALLRRLNDPCALAAAAAVAKRAPATELQALLWRVNPALAPSQVVPGGKPTMRGKSQFRGVVFPRNGVSRDCLLENLCPPEIRVASPPSRLVPSCSSELGPRIGHRLNARAGEGLPRERLSLRYEPALLPEAQQRYTTVLPRGARQCCEAGLRVTSATPVSLVAREASTVFLFLPWRLPSPPPLRHAPGPCCALRQR